MDTLLSLRVFAEVAEHKNFSAVAQQLGLSPAMTSKHVKHVEARVGARLLNRNSRNVSLTEAGAQYLQTILPLLDGLSEAEAQLATDRLSPRGKLKMSMPVWMSNPAFAKILTAYHLQNPHVTFDIDLSGRNQLVAAPAFLDRFGRPQTSDDLNGAPLLAYAQVAADGRLKFGGSDGVDIKLDPILVSPNESILQQAAIAGMGFAILPNWAIQNDLEDGRLETVLTKIDWPKLHIQAIYADRSYLPAKVRSFLDFLAGPEGFSSVLK